MVNAEAICLFEYIRDRCNIREHIRRISTTIVSCLCGLVISFQMFFSGVHGGGKKSILCARDFSMYNLSFDQILSNWRLTQEVY